MTIRLILPWIGELPWYWPLFEASVKHSGIELVLVRGDAEYFRKRVEESLPGIARCGLQDGYKLCDLKPMYGRIFAAEIGDADYWAFGDCDLVYGRMMRAWLKRMTDKTVDVACVRRDWTSGPFTLMRNCDKVNSLYERAANWREVVESPHHCGCDELGHNWLTRHLYGGVSMEKLRSEGNFAGVMWSADDVKFVHEDILCEDGLRQGEVKMHPDGRLMFNDGEIAAFHFIGVKQALGFNVNGGLRDVDAGYILTHDGYWDNSWANRGRLWVSTEIAKRWAMGLVDFAYKCLKGKTAARLRLKRVVLRKLGNKNWWRYV